MNNYLITALGMALEMPAIPALATNGYFAHCYGLKAKGMGAPPPLCRKTASAAPTTPPAWCGQVRGWTSVWTGSGRCDRQHELVPASPR